MLTVSVVIPVLNDAEMLRHCLAAIELQTRPADHIVVVDNASTDDSAQVAERFGAKVVREPQVGVMAATARGFDTAPGDVLARVDADSRPPPDWLARVVRHFERDRDLVAVTGTGHFYGSTRTVHALGDRLYLGGYFWSVGWLLGHPPLFGSNFAIRSEAWREIGPRTHRNIRLVHDDLDLSFQVRPGMEVRYDPELTMPVSARPFSSPAGLTRRVVWGFRTMWINHREENLFQRRAAVRAATRRSPGP